MKFFSPFLSSRDFLYPSFSGVKKYDVTTTNFNWKIPFCDPQIEGIPKTAISIELALCCNSDFSQNTRLHFFNQVLIRIVQPVKKVLLSKINGFMSRVTVPKVQKLCEMQSFPIHLNMQTDFPQQPPV